MRPAAYDNQQKRRTGFSRLWHALGYSVEGLGAAWTERAFRLEAMAALVMVPSAFWLGRTWVERGLLVASVSAVLVVELLNSAVETAIDRIGPEMHPLAKRAKDLGSAAVLVAVLTCGGIWMSALWRGWSE